MNDDVVVVKMEDKPLLEFVHEMNQDEMLIPFVQMDEIELPIRLVEVKKSTIAGRGIFACVNIEAGYDLGRYCPHTPFTKPPWTGSEYGLEVHVNGKIAFLDGMGEHGDIVHWTALVNHSCFPNITFSSNGSMIVLRAIQQGEELTINYGMKYWKCVFPKITDENSIMVLVTQRLTDEETLLKNQLYKKYNITKMWHCLSDNITLEIQRRKALTEKTIMLKRQDDTLFRQSLISKNRKFGGQIDDLSTKRMKIFQNNQHDGTLEHKEDMELQYFQRKKREPTKIYATIHAASMPKANVTCQSSPQQIVHRQPKPPKLPNLTRFSCIHLKKLNQISKWSVACSTKLVTFVDPHHELLVQRLRQDPDCCESEDIELECGSGNKFKFLNIEPLLLETLLDLRENHREVANNIFEVRREIFSISLEQEIEENLESLKYLSSTNEFVSVWYTEMNYYSSRVVRVCHEIFMRSTILFRDESIQKLIDRCKQSPNSTIFYTLANKMNDFKQLHSEDIKSDHQAHTVHVETEIFHCLSFREKKLGAHSKWSVSYSKTNVRLNQADQVLLERLQKDPDCYIFDKQDSVQTSGRSVLKLLNTDRLTLDSLLDLREHRMETYTNIIQIERCQFSSSIKRKENIDSLKYLSKTDELVSVWYPKKYPRDRRVRICTARFLETDNMYRNNDVIQSLIKRCKSTPEIMVFRFPLIK